MLEEMLTGHWSGVAGAHFLFARDLMKGRHRRETIAFSRCWPLLSDLLLSDLLQGVCFVRSTREAVISPKIEL